MSNMIERVARAIAKVQGDDFDALPQDKSEWIEARGQVGGRWRDVNEPRKDDYLGMAEAAIDAMREPTPAISGIETGSISYSADQLWQSMIDAALKPEVQP